MESFAETFRKLKEAEQQLAKARKELVESFTNELKHGDLGTYKGAPVMFMNPRGTWIFVELTKLDGLRPPNWVSKAIVDSNVTDLVKLSDEAFVLKYKAYMLSLIRFAPVAIWN